MVLAAVDFHLASGPSRVLAGAVILIVITGLGRRVGIVGSIVKEIIRLAIADRLGVRKPKPCTQNAAAAAFCAVDANSYEPRSRNSVYAKCARRKIADLAVPATEEPDH